VTDVSITATHPTDEFPLIQPAGVENQTSSSITAQSCLHL
jgi:hypothetical protein